MSQPSLSTGSNELFIQVDDSPPLYLKDHQDYITKERYSWIEQFVAVKSVETGYEILVRLKKGDYAKWSIDPSGVKQKREMIDATIISQVLTEFEIDPTSLNFEEPKQQSLPKPEKLIVHCSHHKVATTFFGKILKQISKEFGWSLQVFKQKKRQELIPETDILLDCHSQVDFLTFPPYVGSHIIRDPRDLIVSAYFYHLWCQEKWCQIPKDKYGGKTYQQFLNSLSPQEGLKAEITHSSSLVKNMLSWNYANPNIVEVRLEDLAKNEVEIFTKIFQKYGFNDSQMNRSIAIVEENGFEKRAGRQRGEEDKKNHFRKGVAGDWKNHFTADHKALFKELHPGALAYLKYEQDDTW